MKIEKGITIVSAFIHFTFVGLNGPDFLFYIIFIMQMCLLMVIFGIVLLIVVIVLAA